MQVDDDQSQATPLPEQTLEAVAKTIFRQSQEYGFSRKDFVRFVNILLDLGLEKSEVYTPPASQKDEITTGDTLDDKKITVRLYEDGDFPLLEKWTDDPVGKLFLLTRTDPTHHNSLKKLINSKSTVFAIVSLDDIPIGALAYLNLDRQQGKAELRKLIGDKRARGQGYAKTATQYWIEYGISTLGLRKIYVNTLDNNLGNIKLNEMLGFRVEGLLRDEVLIDGKYKDLLRMSLILPR